MTEQLWTPRDIAHYSHYCVDYVREVISKKSTFPKPIGVGRRLLWEPEEVKRWFLKQRA